MSCRAWFATTSNANWRALIIFALSPMLRTLCYLNPSVLLSEKIPRGVIYKEKKFIVLSFLGWQGQEGGTGWLPHLVCVVGGRALCSQMVDSKVPSRAFARTFQGETVMIFLFLKTRLLMLSHWWYLNLKGNIQVTTLAFIGPGHWQEGKGVETCLTLCLYSKCILDIVSAQ